MYVLSASYSIERILLSNHECGHFKAKFSHKDHDFGIDDNTTFYVYVYDFKTPFWLQVNVMLYLLYALFSKML